MFQVTKSPKYDPVYQDEDIHNAEGGLHHSEKPISSSRRSETGVPIIVVVILLISTSIIFSFIGYRASWGSFFEVKLSDNICTEQTSKFCKISAPKQTPSKRDKANSKSKAPVLEDVQLNYKEVEFDGRFVKENVYRHKAPSPETDKAWEALSIGSM